MNGEHFWARGYAVSPVGHDEVQIRDYIRRQERQDQEEDEGRFWEKIKEVNFRTF